MRAIKKKQARAFQLQPGIRGEVRLVERAFGIGPDMMSELMSLHGAELGRESTAKCGAVKRPCWFQWLLSYDVL